MVVVQLTQFPKKLSMTQYEQSLPGVVVRLMVDLYEDVHTVIKWGTMEVPVRLQREVMQSRGQPWYAINEPTSIFCLTFVDDLLLMTTNVSQARHLTRISAIATTEQGKAHHRVLWPTLSRRGLAGQSPS